MPAISLAGVDTAGGGLIISSSGVQSTIGGSVIAVNGDAVAPHGLPPHDAATLVASHSSTIAGHRIVTAGDIASCGHPVTGSASSTLD